MVIMVTPVPPATRSDRADYPPGYFVLLAPEYPAQELRTVVGQANAVGATSSMLPEDLLGLYERLFVDNGRVVLSVDHLAIYEPPAKIDGIGHDRFNQ